MEINFYLRGNTINCSVCFDNNRVQKSTGQITTPSDWSDKAERVKKSGARSNLINELLERIDNGIHVYFSECHKERLQPNKDVIKEIISGKIEGERPQDLITLFNLFIEESKAGIRTTQDGKKITDGTIKGYGSSMACFVSFLAISRVNQLNQLTPQFLAQWQEWQWQDKGVEGQPGFKPGYYDNYVGKNARVYNTFASWLEKTGRAINLPRARVWRELVDICVLYPEELKALSAWSPADQSIGFIRDVFLIGCITCMRVSNLLSLTGSHIHRVDDQINIRARSVKTDTPLYIPLNEYGATIIRKYENPDCLFQITDISFNEKLKDMAKMFREYMHYTNSDINNWKSFAQTRKRRGKSKSFVVDFADVISSHTMRRTGATFLFMNGWSMEDVCDIGGWAHGSKEVFRYRKISKERQDQRLKNTWDTAIKVPQI